MARELEAMGDENVVMIETVSKRTPGSGYLSPIGVIDRAIMVRLASAVSQVGGTRNAFNRIAQKSGAEANGGLTYALVGWKGAAQGAGHAHGAGDAPSLSGVLRPDRQSRFRPTAAHRPRGPEHPGHGGPHDRVAARR